MSAKGSAADGDPINALGAIGVIPVVVIDAAAQGAPLAEALMSDGINGVEIGSANVGAYRARHRSTRST